MARDSAVGSVGKGALGFGVGFVLYFLIRNFRFGGGFGIGEGRAERGDEAGRGPDAPVPSKPPRPSTPPLPKDTDPLLFVVFHPEGFKIEDQRDPDMAKRVLRNALFQRIDLGTEKIAPEEIYRRAGRAIEDKARRPLRLDEVISRIKAGGRDDVRLIDMGNIIQGTWDDVMGSLADSGINRWELWEEVPADRKPGAAPKSPVWHLYKLALRFPPDHPSGRRYTWENVGTGHWNLAPSGEKEPRVSGNARGEYRRRRSPYGNLRSGG